MDAFIDRGPSAQREKLPPIDDANNSDSHETKKTIAKKKKQKLAAVDRSGRKTKRKRKTSLKTEPDTKKSPKKEIPVRSEESDTGGTDEDEAKLEQIVLGTSSKHLPEKVRQVLVADKDSSSASDSDQEPPDELPSTKFGRRQRVWHDEDDNEQIIVLAPVLGRKTNRNVTKMSVTQMIGTKQEPGSNSANTLTAKDYERTLRRAYEKTTLALTTGQPKWADLDRKASGKLLSNRRARAKSKKFSDSDSEADSGDDAVQELTQSTGNYIDKSPFLPSDLLSFKQLRDLTFGHRTPRRISNVEFHRSLPVALVIGEEQKLSLFKINGKDNDLLQSVLFENYPLETGKFLYGTGGGDGRKVLVASRLQPFLYQYDMETNKTTKISVNTKAMSQTRRNLLHQFEVSCDGRFIAVRAWDGLIHLLSANSFEWLGSVKMNCEVTTMHFSRHSPNKLYSHGASGEVYIWDVAHRSCLHRFHDDGCVQGVALAESLDGKYLAAGSNSGIVNLYDTTALMSSNSPTPIKSIPNLTTSVSSLAFNPTNELLALSSNQSPNATRLFHMRSLTTHSNFPGRTSKLGNVTSLDFTPNGGYMIVGNHGGRGMLFRLNYYEQY